MGKHVARIGRSERREEEKWAWEAVGGVGGVAVWAVWQLRLTTASADSLLVRLAVGPSMLSSKNMIWVGRCTGGAVGGGEKGGGNQR